MHRQWPEEQQFQPSVVKRKGSIRPEFEIDGAITGYPFELRYISIGPAKGVRIERGYPVSCQNVCLHNSEGTIRRYYLTLLQNAQQQLPNASHLFYMHQRFRKCLSWK